MKRPVTYADLNLHNAHYISYKKTQNSRKLGYVCGVDIYPPYLINAKKLGIYSDVVVSDIRHLPFKPHSFDTVLCIEVIEHLKKVEGVRLINDLKFIASKELIITTPSFFFHTQESDNPFLTHKSLWHTNELKRLGFKCRGSGIIYQRKGLPFEIARILLGLISYFIPEMARNTIAKWKPFSKRGKYKSWFT